MGSILRFCSRSDSTLPTTIAQAMRESRQTSVASTSVSPSGQPGCTISGPKPTILPPSATLAG